MGTLYDEAVKSAAREYLHTKQALLKERGWDEFDDPEECAAFQYATLICESASPEVWREKLHETNPRLGEDVLGFLKWSDIQRHMHSH